MDNSFENWFLQKKEEFDKEMPVGHENRMFQKLQGNEKPSFLKTKSLLKFAAMLLISISVGAALMHFINQSSVEQLPMAEQRLSLSDVSEEYGMAENYFKMNIERQEKKINQQSSNESFQGLTKALDDLKIEYKELEKELYNNPGNKKIVHAMIKNYELRIELLKSLNQLIQIKQQKHEHYEKSNA